MFTFSAPWATETVERYVRTGRREERRRVKSKEQKAESKKLVKAGTRHGGEFPPGKRTNSRTYNGEGLCETHRALS